MYDVLTLSNSAVCDDLDLSDLLGHSPVASLFESDFSYSCAAAGRISTDMAEPFIRSLIFVRLADFSSVWVGPWGSGPLEVGGAGSSKRPATPLYVYAPRQIFHLPSPSNRRLLRLTVDAADVGRVQRGLTQHDVMIASFGRLSKI